MARSLTINCDSKIVFNDKGTENTPFEIIVTVDGQKDNASFTVTTVLGDWFSYTIERMEDASFSHTGGYVKIILRVDKNLSTEDRYGLIEIEHNCANIIKSVEIKQDGVEYSLYSEYEGNEDDKYRWQFKSIPKELYEEKIVNLKAYNGRAKWYVKEIQQYQVVKGDKFDDVTEEYKGQESQDNLMRQVRVPYDGVFNYRIEEAKEEGGYDRLIVKSFGQIDLITKKNDIDGHPHMRYFFVLSHIDVNNTNKMALDEKIIKMTSDEEKFKYSDRKLFIFDGDEGAGEEYGEGDEIIVVPSEKDSYNFLVNNSKSPIINIPFGGQDNIGVVVISTKNGNSLNYSASLDSGIKWCTINSDGTSISVTENTNGYRECVISYTQSETGEVIKLKISQEASTEKFIFTVNGNTDNFTVPQFGITGSTYTVTVVSKKGNNDIPYTVYQQNNVSWNRYENGVITVDENPSTTERSAVYVFRQEGGSTKPPIYVTISQKANDEIWIFEVTPSSKDVSSDGETVSLTIVSQHNGTFVGYSTVVDGNADWLYYDTQNRTIVVSPYTYDLEGDTRSATVTFKQMESNATQTVQITQKKQEAITVYTFEEDKITVGWEGKFYDEPFAKLYSYLISGTTKTEVPITKITIKDGSFITNTKYEGPFIDTDNNSPYYKITVGVETNINEEPRTGHLTVTNERGEEIVLEVEQVKNGDIILTEFDYIVMNYTWTDYADSEGVVHSRDFDCVMFFNTPSIGAMYKKYSSYIGKEISENDTVYAELAYDQISSKSSDLNRIETQVVYLAKLKEDGYLKKIKNSGDRILKIELYGNLYNVTQAQLTPVSLRKVDLEIHTYLGGTMIRDDAKQTMQNIGGEEKSHQKIQTYYLRSINMISGSSDSNVASFDHLGTLNYNVQDQTAVFSPNSELFNPLTENNK